MIKHLYKSLASVLFFLLVVVGALVSPQKVNAQAMCCPSGFSNCGDIGISDVLSNDQYGCLSLGKNGDWNTCVKVDWKNPSVSKPYPHTETETRAAFACDGGDAGDGIDLKCEWAPLNNPESEYNGKPAFCFGGFSDQSQLQGLTINFSCTDNCGGQVNQLLNKLRGNTTQSYTLDGSVAGLAEDGWYSCVTGSFDSSIKDTVASCLEQKGIAVGLTTVAGVVLGAGISGPNIVTIPVFAYGGFEVGDALTGDCEPVITAQTDYLNNSCSANLRIDLENGELVTDLDASDVLSQFSLCRQAGSEEETCNQCFEQNGLWTAVGCIPRNPTGVLQTIIRIGLTLGGGAALLTILGGAFIFSTSQGDPKKTGQAKDMITSAIIGLLFIIFSITILQFIGVTILQIPGFGDTTLVQ